MTEPALNEAIKQIDNAINGMTQTRAAKDAWRVVREAAERCAHYERALPRTADGVVVVPGMMLYGFERYSVGRRVPSGAPMMTWADMMDVGEVVIVGDDDNPTRTFGDWWADSSKAEAARQVWLNAPSPGGREE